MKEKEYRRMMAMLKKAPNDPLFMADLWEVHKDFEGAESRIEEEWDKKTWRKAFFLHQ